MYISHVSSYKSQNLPQRGASYGFIALYNVKLEIWKLWEEAQSMTSWKPSSKFSPFDLSLWRIFCLPPDHQPDLQPGFIPGVQSFPNLKWPFGVGMFHFWAYPYPKPESLYIYIYIYSYKIKNRLSSSSFPEFTNQFLWICVFATYIYIIIYMYVCV